jgi:hypothetical protein
VCVSVVWVGEVCVCGEVFEVSGVLEEVGRKRENLESGLGHKERAEVLLHGRIQGGRDPLHHYQSSLRITKTPFSVISVWGTTFRLKLLLFAEKSLRHATPKCFLSGVTKRFF